MMKQRQYDLVIIGGGAAGLAAAIASEPETNGISTALLEKNRVFGKKLRATGNGRANITNKKIPTCEATSAFFNAMGILTRWDDQGRVYPFFESAPQLTEIMIDVARKGGCELMAEETAKEIKKGEKGFLIQTERGQFQSKKVILATGGKAGPMFGCSGDGYGFAKNMGHHVTKTLPVLTGVAVDHMLPSLKGVRQKGQVTLLCDGEPVFSEWGEVQFTDYGLSGICIFNLSRYLRFVGDRGLSPYTIEVDLCLGSEDVQQDPEQFFKTAGILDGQALSAVLQGWFKLPIVTAVLHQAGLPENRPWETMSRQDREQLAAAIHHLSFKPAGTMGFKQAQCTAGGIDGGEVDPKTGESLLVPGLYFAGELLDYDGPCGGYNLDHAFQSGIAAAQAAISVLKQG